ncbi:MLO-like protein 6 [Ziziphus jujuba]|uniref:MLO-like protein 6 n=1 Tax=Ziziphus jujuba TaxID=326968 RepID=A0ABM3I699_ZIZJJ|nr:MLO-like protein 6 [Ziziphus jujuba]
MATLCSFDYYLISRDKATSHHNKDIWFNWPRLILYLIHFVLFQNAFQFAFLAWALCEFGLKSCFHEKVQCIVIRISIEIRIQILCSYVTLPLCALVTKMGSNMRLPSSTTK